MAKKIMIVDDEPDLVAVTSFRLKKHGYNILTASNGQEALDMIKKESPDLVLLDLRLPLISGQDVCKKIKSDPELKNIAVIIFTASASIDIIEKAKTLGADDHLIKPFDSEQLLSTVKKFIG